MLRLVFVVTMLFATFAYAEVRVFDYPECKIYAIEDAPTRPKASLFASVNPRERFVQTAEDYAGSINVFVVEFKSTSKRVMIDTGLGAPKGSLMAELRQAKIAPESISDILITHIHPDHVGGLRGFPTAKVHIAKVEYEAWEEDSSRQGLAKHLPRGKNLILFEYDTEVVPGIHAIKCAGHTPGHTVFQMGKRYFVGDVFHAVDLQVAHPSFCAEYDMAPREAAASRKKALKNFRGEWFGAHIPFPGNLRVGNASAKESHR
ncbi:MAG: MBL fold metallo-hydrolase [Planctomycetia bacterium]|nr:MBL fold metallo-hydrolase [Planctomycetia bacterium]